MRTRAGLCIVDDETRNQEEEDHRFLAELEQQIEHRALQRVQVVQEHVRRCKAAYGPVSTVKDGAVKRVARLEGRYFYY